MAVQENHFLLCTDEESYCWPNPAKVWPRFVMGPDPVGLELEKVPMVLMVWILQDL